MLSPVITGTLFGTRALAGLLGLADGVDPVTGPAAGLKLFGAMIPVALLGLVAAWRVGRRA